MSEQQAIRGKTWGETKSSDFKNEAWDRKVQWFQFPDGDPVQIRLIGPVYIVSRHWPNQLTKFIPGERPKSFPLWCPKFDSVTEELAPDRVCPMCDDFDNYGQVMAVSNAIIRKYQEGRNKRDNPVVPIIVAQRDVNKVFKMAATKNKADPADPVRGCDFTFSYEASNSKNKWTIQREEITPLSEEEQNYELVDFESIIPDYSQGSVAAEHARDMQRSLARFGHYVIPLHNDQEGWNAYKADVKGKRWTEFPDLVTFRGDTKVKATGAPAKSRSLDSASDGSGLPRSTVARKAVSQQVMDEELPEPPPAVVKKAAVVVSKPSEDIEDASFEDLPSKPAPKKQEVVAAPAAVKTEAVSPSGPSNGPATFQTWTDKFKIVWTAKDGEEVPNCYGNYAGMKKCTTCPKNTACVESSTEV